MFSTLMTIICCRKLKTETQSEINAAVIGISEQKLDSAPLIWEIQIDVYEI